MKEPKFKEGDYVWYIIKSACGYPILHACQGYVGRRIIRWSGGIEYTFSTSKLEPEKYINEKDVYTDVKEVIAAIMRESDDFVRQYKARIEEEVKRLEELIIKD